MNLLEAKPIHKVQVGDLVRSVRTSYFTTRVETFMVMAITGLAIYRDNALKTHEMTLRLWEVSESPSQWHDASMNLYKVV